MSNKRLDATPTIAASINCPTIKLPKTSCKSCKKWLIFAFICGLKITVPNLSIPAKIVSLSLRK